MTCAIPSRSTTLARWYRAGEDVAALLPRLSTYLGHLVPGYTYQYLSATPELLELAAARLERAEGGAPMTRIAPTMQLFFTERLAKQRQASPATVTAYRNTFRLLLRFAARAHRHGPLRPGLGRPGRRDHHRVPG